MCKSDTISSRCPQHGLHQKSSVLVYNYLYELDTPLELLNWNPNKTHPIQILKTFLIYDKVRRVKTQFTLWVQLQVPKYMKQLLKVTNACHSKVT